MPQEFYGTDITQPENRTDFLEVYGFLADIGGETVEFDDFPIFEEWVSRNPEEVEEFLRHCSESENPHVRALSGEKAVFLMKVAPDTALDLFEKALSDERSIRQETGHILFDMFKDDVCDILGSLGLARTARLVEAFKRAGLTFNHSTLAPPS